jgi:hypothetical protein
LSTSASGHSKEPSSKSFSNLWRKVKLKEASWHWKFGSGGKKESSLCTKWMKISNATYKSLNLGRASMCWTSSFKASWKKENVKQRDPKEP